MTDWNVTAERGGATWTFGLAADNPSEALAAALLRVIRVDGWRGARITLRRIPPPNDRRRPTSTPTTSEAAS